MFFKCCVRECESTRKNTVLHKFPINEDRHKQWLNCLGLDVASGKNLYVCHKHFEKKFVGSSNSKLTMRAYPSLFTPTEISNGTPDINTENIDPLEHEHCYSRKKKHSDHDYCRDPSSSLGLVHSRPILSVIQVTSPKINENESMCHSAKKLKLDTEEVCTVYPNTQTSSTAAEVDCTPSEEADETKRACVKNITPTKKTIGRKRLISNTQKLTPTAKKIYREYKKANAQRSFHIRAKRALKFSKDSSFQKMTEGCNQYAKRFLSMQIKLCKKKKQGRRFTLDEKLIALAIMKQGPKCYRFLHRIFVLPSPSTLNNLVSKLNLEAGINFKLFEMMKKQVATWKEHKKYCSIIFDEMALGMGVSYDNKRDKINGFVELHTRKNRFADHVLVFMLRGAIHKWQQPVAYYFCEGATSGAELKTIIKEVVEAVSGTGLKPIVLGCDQGTAFQSAIKSLKEETRRNILLQNEQDDVSDDGTIIIGKNALKIIYDPSHLIKGIRNNFLNKNIKLNGKISQWQDIVDVYKTDNSHAESRILHKLNDEHVLPEKIKKMKVKNCVQVLSKTVAAALSYTAQFSHYVDGREVSGTIKNTAEIISFLDDLFDSINGASVSHETVKGKALRSAVYEGSKHHEFWPQAIKTLDSMRFIDNDKEKNVPTLRNFVTTVKSYMKLWQFFKGLGVKIMRPRYFNTDPIENFFGQVRAYNYRNNDPTCHNFSNTFKALTITRVLNFHSNTYNCEDDPAEPIINLKSLFIDNDDEVEDTSKETELKSCSVSNIVRSGHLNDNFVEQVRRERLTTHSKAYVTGWVVNKLLKKIICRKCKESVTSAPNDTTHKWISTREYKDCIKLHKLRYPSEKAVRLFGTIQREANEYLEENAHQKNIKKNIIEIITSKYSLNLVDCSVHESFALQYFIEVSLRFAIFNWCLIINKIMRGSDIVRLKRNHLPYYQALALKKFEKKHNKYRK